MTPEEAIIASIVTDSNYSLQRLRNILNPEHFSDYRLSQVYELILKMDKNKEPVDIVTLLPKISAQMGKDIVRICTDFPGVLNLEKYRDMVIRSYHERRLKGHMAEAMKEPTEESIKKIQAEWKGLQSLGDRPFDFYNKILDYSSELEKRREKKNDIIKTGFESIDWKIPLLKKGEMCVIGARTSLGKTSLLLGMMLHMAKNGHRVVFCTGEMSFNQLMDRVTAMESGVSLSDIRRGNVKEYWDKINSAHDRISKLPIRFVEAAKLSFEKIMPHVIQYNPDILIVDYIQRFSADNKIDSRAAFYSDIANDLRGLSIDRNILVLAASQLGRGVEQRKDRPRLSDLKESGGIEEAPDVVWFLHTEKIECKEANTVEYDMIIAKNRNGPIFEFKAIFNSIMATFREMG